MPSCRINTGRDNAVNGGLAPLVEQEEEAAIPQAPAEVHIYPEAEEAAGAVPEHPDQKREGMQGTDGDFATDHAVDNIMRVDDPENPDCQHPQVPQPLDGEYQFFFSEFFFFQY